MDGDGGCRLHVCGPFFACVHGVDVTPRIPAGQARSLFVYLVITRGTPMSRVRLVDALWPHDPPEHADRDVTVLLSRLRSVVGSQVLPAGPTVELVLPAHAEVDLERAHAHVDHAEHALAARDWGTAWAALARGDDAEAVQVYARLRQRLADDLGVDPGPQSRALFDEVLGRSRLGSS